MLSLNYFFPTLVLTMHEFKLRTVRNMVLNAPEHGIVESLAYQIQRLITKFGHKHRQRL